VDTLIPNLVFILLFTCPGFLVSKAVTLLNEITNTEATDYDKGIWAFFYSFLVFILNFAALTLLGRHIYSISQIANALDSFSFLVKYILLTGLNCVIIVALALLFIRYVLFEFKKREVRKKQNALLRSYLTVWEDIIRGKIGLIPNFSDMCVEIMKGGTVVTQGIIQTYSTSRPSKKDFLLTDVEAIRVYLDNDKKLDDEDKKMFPKILADYYDAESDILIRIYNNSNLLKNFGEQEQCEPSPHAE